MNKNKKDKILVTGCAGFIGMHLCKSLLRDDYQVYGIDNFNDYYDPNLKKERLNKLSTNKNFSFTRLDISDLKPLEKVFSSFKPDKVVNLAAQVGVRYSLENPHAYIKSNMVGFMNILECCRRNIVQGLIYASSSSVYGANSKIPFAVNDPVNQPISIYASTKRANELMAHTYSHLYGIHTTGLRFFTVYGSWYRPDMAMYIFAKNISKGLSIPIFNHGNIKRDFTYIDDIINGMRSAIEKNYKCKIFNLGNNKSENIMEVINIIEDCLEKKAKYDFHDMQPGDVEQTFAEIDESFKLLEYKPSTSIQIGIPKFIKWFKHYY